MFTTIKRTGKEGAIYGIGQGLVMMVAFFLVPLYTRYLPQSDFGKLGLLAMVNALGAIVFSLMLSSALFRSYYDYDDNKGRKVVINTTLILLSIITLVLLALSLAVLPILSKALFGETNSVALLWLIVVKVVAMSFRSVPLALYRIRGMVKKFVVIQLAAVILKIVVIIYLVVIERKGLMGVIAGDAVTSVIITIITMVTIRRDIAPVFSRFEAWKLLAFSLPLVPADLASMVYSRVELVFLDKYTDLRVVAQYNVVLMIMTALQSIIKTPLMLVWTPTILSVAKTKFAGDFYAKVTLYLVTIVSFIAFGISLFAGEIIMVIGGTGYSAAARVLPILCLAQVFYITQVMFNVGIILKRKTRYIPIILGIVAATSIISNFMLVPYFGLLGAGYANLLSSLVFAVMIYITSQHFYSIKYDTIRIAKVFIVLLSAYFLSEWLKILIPEWTFLVIRIALLPITLIILWSWHYFDKAELEILKQWWGRLRILGNGNLSNRKR